MCAVLENNILQELKPILGQLVQEAMKEALDGIYMRIQNTAGSKNNVNETNNKVMENQIGMETKNTAINTQHNNIKNTVPQSTAPTTATYQQMAARNSKTNGVQTVNHKQTQDNNKTRKTDYSNNTLIIKDKNEQGNAVNIYTQIKGAIDPSNLEIDIVNLKVNKQNLFITCKDQESYQILKTNVERIIDTNNWEISKANKFNPKLVIKEARTDDVTED
ncbi:unnamed protein product [Brassicogethes aeneus]|uniref:Uncharacterized protein n=1 Tax=Brassicogethes aeneus TaxID=1431903 RepID=A0A9P0BDA9_BRAAE|nr:unnamed protein product [Brassicogethes aeneus]